MNRDRSAEPGLSLEVALDATGGDKELLKELVDLFLEEYPKLLASLKTAVEGKDAKRIEAAAHKLKGSTSTFGAWAAVQAALQLERQGRLGSLEGIDQALAHLEHTYEPLLVELRDYEPD